MAMGTGRRLAALLIALLVIGAPAAALRVDCVGASCRSSAAAGASAPFCSLPADLRALISAGTYEGRSPDALGVAGAAQVSTEVDRGLDVPWPSVAGASPDAMAAPLLFIGRDVRTTQLPSGLGFDQIAPTLEPILGLRRPHPEVRSGKAIPGVVRPGSPARLVVLIVWKAVGTPDIGGARMPWLDRWSARAGSTSEPRSEEPGVAGGLASARSLPLDPVAVESTIGTGGEPSQHGITGTRVRGTGGRVTFAYGPGAPTPVIAALGDDLDVATSGASLIGLVRDATGDVGLTGDAWYGTGSVLDRVVAAGPDVPAKVDGFLGAGWGADATPDLLAVPLSRSLAADDRVTGLIVEEVLAAVPDATIVVTATGSVRAPGAVAASAPAGVVPGGRGAVAGGFFIDRSTPTTASDVIDAMRAQTTPDGSPLYDDAFAAYAVRFGKYC